LRLWRDPSLRLKSGYAQDDASFNLSYLVYFQPLAVSSRSVRQWDAKTRVDDVWSDLL
jgi:hypothetical protein